MRTFKIERIERVELLRERYTIPEDFDPRKLLADTWGIWYTNAEPVEVVLRFSPGVARRVRETRWHRSQQIEEGPDVGLIWRAFVAEPQEMLPWIRGWGADVEVLKPKTLRAMLIKEAHRIGKIYGGILPPKPKHFHLWAKADNETGSVHLLIYHMIDVAQVALALWNSVFAESLRQQFAKTLGLDLDDTRRLIAFLTGLHDLGKSSPSFQCKYAPAIVELESIGLTFPSRQSRYGVRHGTISAWALERLLSAETNFTKPIARKIARALGGHHGAWPTPDQLLSSRITQTETGDKSWDQIRRDLFRDMKSLFSPPENIHFPDDQVAENALLTLLSGFTSVSDWIGSMEDFFPFTEHYIDLEQYLKQAADQAQEALHSLGWIGWKPTGDMISFKDMFPKIKQPNEIQNAVIKQTESIQLPCLMILEAPTGIGKTEAALYLADKWMQSSEGRGLYVAMPTQATSNQMFGRVVEYLGNRYPHELINVHLAHSQARWSKYLQDIRLAQIGEEESGRIAAMTWFSSNRKRTLLAPFAVGTVDQALMSVLQTRHFFVRLFGLGHKVVIFDEVHAYDTYMSTLFQRLLSWLQAIGASVIVLTATLPAETRKELIAAYLGKKDITLPKASYPRLTYATPDETYVFPLPSPLERTLDIEWIDKEPETIAQYLNRELQNGGCAAVICNTVKRAQEVYRAIKGACIVDDDNLILFHASFPIAWRNEIEEKVLDHFSKDGKRPEKAIVVATQVIEQSLDLDFDLMVTDLAPVDLILQRAGRLHRHADNPRSERLSSPRLAITSPDLRDGLPECGSDKYVYDEYFLLRTYLTLKGIDQLQVIGQTIDLIETVYGEQKAQTDEKMIKVLHKAQDEMRAQRGKDSAKAKSRLLPAPKDEDLLYESYRELEEDSPEVHRAFQAMTRLIEPGISLICLHQTDRGLSLSPDREGEPIDLTTQPDFTRIDLLIQHTVTIRDKRVLYHLLSHESHRLPAAWEKISVLRHHLLAIFRGGVCDLMDSPYSLHISRELGLSTQEKEV